MPQHQMTPARRQNQTLSLRAKILTSTSCSDFPWSMSIYQGTDFFRNFETAAACGKETPAGKDSNAPPPLGTARPLGTGSMRGTRGMRPRWSGGLSCRPDRNLPGATARDEAKPAGQVARTQVTRTSMPNAPERRGGGGGGGGALVLNAGAAARTAAPSMRLGEEEAAISYPKP